MIRKYFGGIGWEFIGRGAFKEPYAPANSDGRRECLLDAVLVGR